MNKKTIILDGDSWVFGSEILNPIFKNKNIHDYMPENDAYRIPKIFSTHLGNLMNADIVNLGWPADDNGTILNRIITYISTNYINKKISTDNIFVIVGWSSPERNHFWYKDNKQSSKFRIWPQDRHTDSDAQQKIWDLYVSYLWNEEEYIPRYVMNVIQLQNFCNAHNIKWMCFNSFYQTPNSNPKDWEDLNIKNELSKLSLSSAPYSISNTLNRQYYKYEYQSLWETINPIRFYKKEEKNNTFKSFMEAKIENNAYSGWHPSPESHRAWANELHSYIIDNNLL
jgi:hypothetical protein